MGTFMKSLRSKTLGTPVDKIETPAMFSEIASRYDLLNHVLSFNVDRLWRRRMVRMAGLPEGGRVLDACTGTADVAIKFAQQYGDAKVCGLDRSPGMLAVGREKIERKGLGGRVTLYEGDVLDLPFSSATFDAVSIAFGLRNLPDCAGGIAEMSRVLKPGGRLLILEFAPPSGGIYLKGYRFYLRNVLPLVGGVVSGSRRAYSYLASSIDNFFSADTTLTMMTASDLVKLTSTKLAGGVAYIYQGEKSV